MGKVGSAVGIHLGLGLVQMQLQHGRKGLQQNRPPRKRVRLSRILCLFVVSWKNPAQFGALGLKLNHLFIR